MRYVAAYLLAALGGKENPSQSDVEKILSSVGIESDAEKLKIVLKELNGKNLEEVIAAGGSFCYFEILKIVPYSLVRIECLFSFIKMVHITHKC